MEKRCSQGIRALLLQAQIQVYPPPRAERQNVHWVPAEALPLGCLGSNPLTISMISM